MKSFDDQPAIAIYLLALVVLVLVGTGFTALLDNRNSFGGSGVRQEVVSQEEEIDRLKYLIASSRERLADQSELRDGAAELVRLAKTNGESRAKLSNLQARHAVALAGAKDASDQYRNYRLSYRDMIWRKAVGEKIPESEFKGSKVYSDASISKVTPVGLELRHEHGVARVSPSDLSDRTRARFMWDEEERQQVLEKERANLALVGTREEQPRASAPRRAEKDPDEILYSTRTLVRDSRLRIEALKQQIESAVSDSRGGAVSVPGSLETYQNRIKRLQGDLIRAQATLSRARDDLRSISPRDPLLSDW